MSADGSIEVAVRAEGTDEAAAELADADADGVPGGGGDGDGGDGGLAQSIRGGIIGGLVSQVLGPLLNVLSPMLNILSAFLAPVAALLLRLFAPVLRFFLRLLPAWIAFVNDVPGLVSDAIDFIQSLPGRIWDFMSSLPRLIWQKFKNGINWLTDDLPQLIWEKFKDGIDWLTDDLPSQIATKLGEKITSVVPNVVPTGEDGGGGLPILGGPIAPVDSLGPIFDAINNIDSGGGPLDGNLGIYLRLDDAGIGELFRIVERETSVDNSP